jgi:hypothetical protein
VSSSRLLGGALRVVPLQRLQQVRAAALEAGHAELVVVGVHLAEAVVVQLTARREREVSERRCHTQGLGAR